MNYNKILSINNCLKKMNSLDFLSDSPRTYKFQRRSNKTNSGGVLTLIYFIILALIIVAFYMIIMLIMKNMNSIIFINTFEMNLIERL